MLTGFSLTAMSASAEEITDLFYKRSDIFWCGRRKNWRELEIPQFVGEKAVDGDETTRWSADKQDEQWLIVDLGEVKTLANSFYSCMQKVLCMKS